MQDVEELMALAPEKLLLKWMNFHLKKGGYKKTVTNFSSDVKVACFGVDNENNYSTLLYLKIGSTMTLVSLYHLVLLFLIFTNQVALSLPPHLSLVYSGDIL